MENCSAVIKKSSYCDGVLSQRDKYAFDALENFFFLVYIFPNKHYLLFYGLCILTLYFSTGVYWSFITFKGYNLGQDITSTIKSLSSK